MIIPIEDNYEDVLGKAMAGLRLDLGLLSKYSGLTETVIKSLLDGHYDLENLQSLAPCLSLDVKKLVRLANNDWLPSAYACEGLRNFNTPFPVPGYEEMTVNNFLVWDRVSNEGCIFDTGADVAELLAYIQKEKINIRALFLTHTHRDHVAAYDALLKSLEGVVPYASELEGFANANSVKEGAVFTFGSLRIEARLTNGHSPGGMSYLIEGLSEPLAIVGDSIFCLSMGKANDAYELALDNNRDKLLSLPPKTILCPGHGPLTTVAVEQARNPFF